MKLLPAVCLASLSLGSTALANKVGIGFTNCNSCHSGGTIPATRELFLTSLTVAPGETVPVDVRFSGPTGGFAMQASGGTLANADATSKVVGAALTHTQPKAIGADGLVHFEVNWKAPSIPGTYLLEAWCNSVNGNNQKTGDKAAVASAVVTVATGGGSTPDAGQPVQDAGSPSEPDAGNPTEPDAGNAADLDGGTILQQDAGSAGPGGETVDAGNANTPEPTGGCSAVGGSGLAVFALLAWAASSRRRPAR